MRKFIHPFGLVQTGNMHFSYALPICYRFSDTYIFMIHQMSILSHSLVPNMFLRKQFNFVHCVCLVTMTKQIC